MQRAVLEHMGLLPGGERPRMLFLFAYDELRVSDEFLPDDEPDSWFFGHYCELGAAADTLERAPHAAFGWLVPVSGDEDALVVVKAASDPSEGRARTALERWAADRRYELRDLLDESPT
jgi:hypothetical protein